MIHAFILYDALATERGFLKFIQGPESRVETFLFEDMLWSLCGTFVQSLGRTGAVRHKFVINLSPSAGTKWKSSSY